MLNMYDEKDLMTFEIIQLQRRSNKSIYIYIYITLIVDVPILIDVKRWPLQLLDLYKRKFDGCHIIPSSREFRPEIINL